MLTIAIIFLLVALLAYWLGGSEVGSVALLGAKICFVIFIILLVLSLLGGAFAPGPYWHWPLG